MSYNAKNYTEQGGNKTIIGGELEIKSGATLKLEEGAEVQGLPAGGTKLYMHKLTVGSYPNQKVLKFITTNPEKITVKGTSLINYLSDDEVVFKSFQGSTIFRFGYKGTNNMTAYYFTMNSDTGVTSTETTQFDSNSYVDTVTEL